MTQGRITGDLVIATQHSSMQDAPEGGLSLLFAKGRRPSRSDVARLAGLRLAASEGGFALGHLGEPDEGLVELVAAGLSFDLSGLRPAAARPMPMVANRFDGGALIDLAEMECLRLDPGAHLAGGQAMLPVARTMLGLAARLVALPGAAAISWHPARSLMGAGLFIRQVDGWLAGGAFPALGLTALQSVGGGALQTEGLAFFTGQELVIDDDFGGVQSSARMAVRLIHNLVEDGPVMAAMEFQGLDGGMLRAVPEEDGRLVRVSARSKGSTGLA